MRIVYNILVRLYSLSIHIASLFNNKAKLWVDGRKNTFEQLEKKIRAELKDDEELIWFHCASLGEFEQGRTIIEKFKVQSSRFKVLLTFFSPSGYEVQKNYKGADFVFYLPIDTPGNAKRFVEMLPLKAAFFVKYEFWFNYLFQLRRKTIPTYLISGIFREEQYFFKWYGRWARNQLKAFKHFFLQDEKSKQLLTQFGFTNTTLSGDTRFDRVYEIAQNKKEFPLIKLFAEGAKVLVAGSTWEDDEELVISCRLSVVSFKIIVAPHEIDEDNINQVVARFSRIGKCLRYSQANEQNIKQSQILIIDNIGMLSLIYQYGQVAYIGGGFGDGIHNILEAATFGLPTIFGPNYKKFNEAEELIKSEGSFPVNNISEFETTINKLFNDKGTLSKASAISKNYVVNKKGATEIITSSIKF
ncbi:MAG: 3-deoxy-D-manno-octulosonic acid transferase [Bacteroidia bacterium]|nr:3-deoxy-D-manno-octulosonic acid transferase [Bacteroidia bacterium]